MPSEKFCLFCGNPPHRKNREHILPRWLIETTGQYSRQMRIGPIYGEGLRTQSFSNFVFPSCEDCNAKFGRELEDGTKLVVDKLLEDAEVSANEFTLLLDWFDKIRVGLWLGFGQYLNKNALRITPHFYIRDRIRQSDRMLLVFRSDPRRKYLLFSGANTPLFTFHPVCIGLCVNHLGFVNIATHYITAKLLGFPYSHEVQFDYPIMNWTLEPGTEFLELGSEVRGAGRRMVALSQACYSLAQTSSHSRILYETEFVRRHQLQPGVSNVAVERGERFEYYPEKPSRCWLPNDAWTDDEMPQVVAMFTLLAQIKFTERFWPSEERPEVVQKAIEINESMIRRFAS